ncbi:hypothetical protein HDK77DRAFT_187196 [Phyllosticta capitalensis]
MERALDGVRGFILHLLSTMSRLGSVRLICYHGRRGGAGLLLPSASKFRLLLLLVLLLALGPWLISPLRVLNVDEYDSRAYAKNGGLHRIRACGRVCFTFNFLQFNCSHVRASSSPCCIPHAFIFYLAMSWPLNTSCTTTSLFSSCFNSLQSSLLHGATLSLYPSKPSRLTVCLVFSSRFPPSPHLATLLRINLPPRPHLSSCLCHVVTSLSAITTIQPSKSALLLHRNPPSPTCSKMYIDHVVNAACDDQLYAMHSC